MYSLSLYTCISVFRPRSHYQQTGLHVVEARMPWLNSDGTERWLRIGGYYLCSASANLTCFTGGKWQMGQEHCVSRTNETGSVQAAGSVCL